MQLSINNIIKPATGLAYDNGHKVYVLENEEDYVEATNANYNVLPVENLAELWPKCGMLRFLSSWRGETIVPQAQDIVELKIDGVPYDCSTINEIDLSAQSRIIY